MTTGSLLVFPADPAADPPGTTDLLRLLAEMQLIGEPLPGAAGFLPGAAFARHVVFAGCSPHLVLAPPADGGGFSAVRILGPHTAAVLLAGDNAVAPRCPACRARIDRWRERLGEWVARPATPWPCPACGHLSPASGLDWRSSAAAGRLFIEVGNVFPGEAVPSEALLEALRGLGGKPWRHAWIRGGCWRVPI